MYKDVLVHLDGSAGDEERLLHAEAIATQWQGHVTGILTNPMPDYGSFVSADGGAGAAALLAELEQEAHLQGATMAEKLDDRFSRLGVPGEIRRIDDIPSQLAERAGIEARWADIFVVGRPYGEPPEPLLDSLFESVLFDGGCGVLVVPPGRPPAAVIRRVLICWRDTREASRAVALAMSIIQKTARAVILAVDPRKETADGKTDPVADIARHLSRHGAQVEAELVESKGRELCEVILEHANRISADLVVMGGYGHSRAREWMLGGATRDMLTRSSFPIFMAH